jgi:hypothetical protein
MIVAARVLGMTRTGRLDHNRASTTGSWFMLMVVVRVMRAILIHSFVLFTSFPHGEALVERRQ